MVNGLGNFEGPGCYAIFHDDENKVYIGSSKNVETRRAKHFNDLKRGNHSNFALQYDYNNDGNPFTFVVLDKECSEVDLRRRECEFMEYYLNQGFLLYNSNLSCKRDVPYYMVKPTAYETNYNLETSDDIAALELSVKKLREENRELIEKNKKISSESSLLKGEIAILESQSLLGQEPTISNLTSSLNQLEYSIELMLKFLEVDEYLYNDSVNTFCDMVNIDLNYIQRSVHNHYLEEYREIGFIDRLIGWYRPSQVNLQDFLEKRPFQKKYPKSHMSFVESMSNTIKEMKSLLSGEEDED